MKGEKIIDSKKSATSFVAKVLENIFYKPAQSII